MKIMPHPEPLRSKLLMQLQARNKQIEWMEQALSPMDLTRHSSIQMIGNATPKRMWRGETIDKLTKEEYKELSEYMDNLIGSQFLKHFYKNR